MISVVRKVTINFLQKRIGKTRIEPEPEENALAMAFIMAESGRKSKNKLKYLAPISIPFWIVQVSDTKSIVLAANGETSTSVNLSEDAVLAPVRKVLTTEAKDFADIPGAVEKALPMIGDVEQTAHHITNLQDPKLFMTLGKQIVDADPNARVTVIDLKISSQSALNISSTFQKLMKSTSKRLGIMKEFQIHMMERLSGRIMALDNVITSETARLEKRYKTLEESTELRINKLKDKSSTNIYRLREQRKKNQESLISGFARDTVSVERFFSKLTDHVKAFRLDIKQDPDLDSVVQKYQSLVEYLDGNVQDYSLATNSVGELTEHTLKKSIEFDEELATNIQTEEESLESLANEHQERLIAFKEEMDEKDAEFTTLKKQVTQAVDKVDGIVKKRVEGLRKERERLESLTFENAAIKDLAPLTLLYINTYAVAYNKGAPVVLTPVFSPLKKVSLVSKHEPFNPQLDEFLQASIKTLSKNPSFKTSFESALAENNIFYNPESIGQFKKGIDNMRRRKLLKEGFREELEPLFVKLVGRCPKCGSDIGSSSKFCPECGVSLL